MAKSRFFREQTNSNRSREIEDVEIPGQGLYVRPFALQKGASIGIDSPLKELQDFDPSIVVTYKRSATKIFTCARVDLPQYFVDSRVQVRMTENMGKGCFALEDIEKNTVVESAPIILVHKDTFGSLNDINGGTHKLSEYPFGWGRDGMVAFALGYGGIYNHKVNANLSWRPNYENEALQYTAVRDIKAGEEMFIRYLPLYRLSGLWFHDEESEEYAKKHEVSVHEDPGTIKSWKMFVSGEGEKISTI